MSKAFLGVDWGTTSRRVFHIEEGEVVATERDDRGASALAAGEYPTEVAAIRKRFGDLPMLLAGMVGSNIGWRNVPYAATPARLEDLAAGLEWIDARTAIVPGVASEANVMRGEEVQLLGACATGRVPGSALLAQPGTHCKWARIEDGAIAAFTTAMTGELFALLKARSLLSSQLTAEAAVGPAFVEGVAEGARRDLVASLFGVRARGVLGLLDDKDAASYASGILIGADVVARIEPGETVHLLADKTLGGLYAAAVDQLGGRAYRVDSHAAFVAGISRIWELAQ